MARRRLGRRLTGVALAAALMAAGAQAQPDGPPASIEDAAWLAGRWVGAGFGGTVEENWSPPAGDRMVGHFSLAVGGRPTLYEFALLEEHEGGLRMRVKHFDPDFVGWEERGAWQSFEPLAVAPQSLRFDGLWLRLEGDELVATVTLRNGAEPPRDHTLRLRRAPL